MIRSKQNYRVCARNKINQINDKDIFDKIIVNKILNDINFINAKKVAIFYPFKNEINLLDIMNEDKVFLFPKINKKDKSMNFIEVNKQTKWKINYFGINEPINGKINNEDIDMFIVSSLARNTNDFRLGHGGGYYDRFFAKFPKGIKVGVIYNNLTYKFNEEEYDIKLDYFISNKE